MIPNDWIQDKPATIAQLEKYGFLLRNVKVTLHDGSIAYTYVDLRSYRSDPKVLAWLADLYELPLNALSAKRRLNGLAEVPHAMSGVVAVLSQRLQLPYVTIRAEAKLGHATSAKMIGRVWPGQRIVLVDDVITTGASKAAAIGMLRQAGAKVTAIVVLVDRREKPVLLFQGVPIWAGLRLADLCPPQAQ